MKLELVLKEKKVRFNILIVLLVKYVTYSGLFISYIGASSESGVGS